MKSFVIQSAAILAGVAVLTTLVAFVHPQAPAWYRVVEPSDPEGRQEVTPEEILAGKWAEEGILWLDARASKDFEAGHLPEALLLNEAGFEDQLWTHSEEFTNLDRLIVVYCDGLECERSDKIAGLLRERLQLRNVWVLRGDWKKLNES